MPNGLENIMPNLAAQFGTRFAQPAWHAVCVCVLSHPREGGRTPPVGVGPGAYLYRGCSRPPLGCDRVTHPWWGETPRKKIKIKKSPALAGRPLKNLFLQRICIMSGLNNCSISD